MKVILGSTSAVKLNAVRLAFAEAGLNAEITGVKASSGIDEQPLGLSTTLEGATNRCRDAIKLAPGADFYIAIENGILREGTTFADRAIIMMMQGEETFSTFSQGVAFPAEAVARSVASNLTVTAGKFTAEMGLVKQHDDPHADLDLIEHPGIRKSRAQILKEAVVEALHNF